MLKTDIFVLTEDPPFSKRISWPHVGRFCPDGRPSFLLSCIFLAFTLLGCAKNQFVLTEDPASVSRPAYRSQRLYNKSREELARGNHKQAYRDYQRAVEAAPICPDGRPCLANVSYLSSILYAWVISQSETEDVPLLNAQMQVWLEPTQLAPRRELLSAAIDKEEGIIHAFGLGLAPKNAPNLAQKRLLALQAALADSKAWAARLTMWAETGVKCPFDVTTTVIGVETLKKFWVEETICVVKIRAPIDCHEADEQESL